MSFREVTSDQREIGEKTTRVGDAAIFDPDKRLDISNRIKDVVKSTFNPDKRLDYHYTTYQERLKCCASEENDSIRFKGVRGESIAVPRLDTEKGRALAEKLKEFGQRGIDFKNCLPDFSKVAQEQVSIKMTSDRPTNFKRADIELAKKWSAEAKDGKSKWSPEDVKAWRKENGLTIHEDADMKTCYYVSTEIHDKVPHSGGIAECSRRDGVSSGGRFDA